MDSGRDLPPAPVGHVPNPALQKLTPLAFDWFLRRHLGHEGLHPARTWRRQNQRRRVRYRNAGMLSCAVLFVHISTCASDRCTPVCTTGSEWVFFFGLDSYVFRTACCICFLASLHTMCDHERRLCAWCQSSHCHASLIMQNHHVAVARRSPRTRSPANRLSLAHRHPRHHHHHPARPHPPRSVNHKL